MGEMIKARRIHIFDRHKTQNGQQGQDDQIQDGRQPPEKQIKHNDIPVAWKALKEMI